MAISSSPRLGLTRWSADTDQVSRAQFDGDHGRLDDLVAMATQGVAVDRPAAAVPRRLYYATDTGVLSLDTGTVWVEVLTEPRASAAYVEKAGGTMTGPLRVDRGALADPVDSVLNGVEPVVGTVGADSVQLLQRLVRTSAGPGGATTAAVEVLRVDQVPAGSGNLIRASIRYLQDRLELLGGFLSVSGGLLSDRMRTAAATIGTSESTTSTAFTDLTTVGPDVVFTAPPSGVVQIDTLCRANVDVAGNAALMSHQVLRNSDSAVIRDAADSNSAVTRGASNATMSNSDPITGLTPGTQYRVRARYRATAGTATFLDRRVIVTPSP
jgi:hypothetical protein